MADEVKESELEVVQVEAGEPVSAQDDVHNDVAAALASLKGDGEPSVVQVESDAPVRERGADGKFISKDAAPVEAAAPEQKSPPPGDTTKASDPQPSTAETAPPVSWAADAKAGWASLSPAIQAAVLKREAEVSAGFRQKSEDARRYEAAIGPVAQESQKRGISVEEGIQRLIDGNRFLETKPVEAIQWLAQRHGIDLAQLASNPPVIQRQADPMVAQVIQTVPQIEQRLASIEHGHNLTLIGSFATTHPHYQDVENDLPGIIQEIKKVNPGISPSDALNAAYDRAIWLNPDVRSKIIAEQNAEAEKQRLADMAEKSTQAKRAAVSIKGSSAAVTPPRRAESNGSAFDDVRQTIAQLRAG